ncbi:MAG: hypothetical protein HQK89_15955 [Nitrospirae bacterium]|nr:hypothetical protein [Nitrospirota bacterium]
MATSIDTLKIYERLKAANLDKKIAKEIAEVFKESIEDRFVTMKDLDDALDRLETKLETKLVSEIEKSKFETIKWTFLFWVGQLAAMVALFKFFLAK